MTTPVRYDFRAQLRNSSTLASEEQGMVNQLPTNLLNRSSAFLFLLLELLL